MKTPSAWRRAMCAFYEGVLLFGIVWFFGYAFSAFSQFRGEPGGARLAFQLYMALVLGAYFVWSWSRGRRTLPMKTMSVRLVTAGGAPLSPMRATGRYLAAAVLLSLPLAGAQAAGPLAAIGVLVPFGWLLIDPQRRTLWDLLAGTRMVMDERAA